MKTNSLWPFQKRVIMNKKIVSLLSILLPGLATAQAADSSGGYLLEIVLALAVVVAVIALIVLLVTLNVVKVLLAAQKEEEAAEAVVEEEPSAVGKLWVSINDFQPIEEESKVLTDHEYDGIRELDNNLPPWWKWLFYASIGFAAIYLVYFHVLGMGPSSGEEYIAEMEAAEVQKAAYQAQLAANMGDAEIPTEGPEAILAGQSVFIKFCAACHGNVGQGGPVGPNLTDQYWIHGGSRGQILSTIENGVPAKGMVPWKGQLAPTEIQQLASYIISLEGTNPPDGKAPQGDLYDRAAEEGAEEAEEAETGEPVALNE